MSFYSTALARLLAALFVAGGLVSPVAAQSGAAARSSLLVDSEWLARHKNDANLVLLHVGERPEYDQEHIPGAHYITMQDVSGPRPATPEAGLTLELPDAAALREKLQGFGISDDSRIIVYWGNDWLSPAGRIMFALDWIGLGAQTSVLDGGMPAWKRAGHEVTATVPAPKPGRLSARPTKDLVVDAAFVQSLPRSGFALVDARPPAFYDGVREGQNGKKGHIRGAGNVPYNGVAGEDGVFLSADELRAMFEKAGVKPGDTVVGYCFIGQYATAMLFAARTLGYDVRLYDGSFEDWARRDLPVEETPAKQDRP